MAKNYKMFKQILYEVMYILRPEQKKRLVYVLFVILISSFFELLGVTAILPFGGADRILDLIEANKGDSGDVFI